MERSHGQYQTPSTKMERRRTNANFYNGGKVWVSSDTSFYNGDEAWASMDTSLYSGDKP